MIRSRNNVILKKTVNFQINKLKEKQMIVNKKKKLLFCKRLKTIITKISSQVKKVYNKKSKISFLITNKLSLPIRLTIF